jgi:hypothetical protein
MSSTEGASIKGELSELDKTCQEINFDDVSQSNFMDISTARGELFGTEMCDELEFATLGLLAEPELGMSTQGELFEFSTCEEINLDTIAFAQSVDGRNKTSHFKIWQDDDVGGIFLGEFEDGVATNSDFFDFETCEEIHLVDKAVLPVLPFSFLSSTSLRAPQPAQG